MAKRHKQLTGEENESEDKSDPEIETEEEDMEDELEDGDDQEGNDVMHDDGQKDAEMEELEKEYMNLRQQEQDLLKNLKRHKDEDFLKGQAVKNQVVLWDKALEIRISLQNAFSKSNKLPQGPLRSSYCDSDESVNQAYAELITSSEQTLDSLLKLQEALLGNNPSIAQTTDGNIKGSSKGTEASEKANAEDDKEWSRVYQLHSRIAPFRDSSINKWQRKTQVTTGAAAFKGKLHAFNQNISEQVAAYMRDPNRMIKRMQLRRSAVGIFGTGPDTAGNKEEDANVDGDPELLDDSDFYQQLIKEFIETFDPTSSEASLHGEKKLQTKKRKIVDRRASKSRKIRYHVHEKIVNFMAPERMNLPPMAPKLFENLFGLKNK